MNRYKIIKKSKLKSLGKALRTKKKRIVFTNGTFDLLHLGHVTYLEKAKCYGDILIVGVNSDASVRSYKSPGRPLNPEKDRLDVLAALSCVDYVTLFSDPTPICLIQDLRPHVLVKGADWKKSQIAGAKEVESWRGQVKRIPLVKGHSTTQIIKKIKHLS
ncbi:MAG: D-glycero-beta-D-manno-heptose 1-phosphate adenylyltransferase [Candidatus Omnitrophica bacterium]|nr:D-glycero-beta-D-manno-heptose 1-phosphate adenylyltransferase [Candidatus Omnitrophota bacterium]